MKLYVSSAVATVTALLFVTGCANMPTPPAQITPAYNSGIQYEGYDCSRLTVEFDALSKRESTLVIAQEQRIKSSNVQAFWLGYGQGDGLEAAELAGVRGEKEACSKKMRDKCSVTETKKSEAPLQK